MPEETRFENSETTADETPGLAATPASEEEEEPVEDDSAKIGREREGEVSLPDTPS